MLNDYQEKRKEKNKKVSKALNKASKTHAEQAKTLSALKLKELAKLLNLKRKVALNQPIQLYTLE